MGNSFGRQEAQLIEMVFVAIVNGDLTETKMRGLVRAGHKRLLALAEKARKMRSKLEARAVTP